MSHKWKVRLAYIALVVGVLAANAVVIQRVSEVVYYNAVDAGDRGNETIREPLNEFFTVFADDESNEQDDPQVAAAARVAVKATENVPCLLIVDKPDAAPDYIPPDER